MGNKARPPMTTADEIIKWATDTREANGTAFTMLTKDEQLLIAKFILAMRDHIKKLQNGMGTYDEAAPDRAPQAETSESKETNAPEGEEIIERPSDITKRQTNMEFFKANGVGMQRAYQLFQTWQDCDPTNRMIQDEKRKAYINSAAFAFWLNLPHE